MWRLTICWLALSALAMIGVAHATAAGRSVSEVRSDKALPCYIVVSNEVSDDKQRREIRIMADKADINEANVINLLRHFSAMYSDAGQLNVDVHTSLNFTLENYKTASDLDELRAVLAGAPYEHKPKVWERDAQGTLVRTRNMEEFRYKAEGGDMSDMKYVLMKGEDPYCHNCKRLKDELLDSQRTLVPQRRETQDGVPCYFEFGNYLMDERRYVGLFINAEDGNEPNLRALLRHVSGQYPEPEPLVINVYINLRQRQDSLVPTAGHDYLEPGLSAYFAAAIFRASGSEVIRYRYPHDKVITVVVQGVDTFPPLRD